MIELGIFSLYLGAVLAIYSLFTGFISISKPILGLISSSRNAIIACCFCVILSSLILWNALLFHDFSVAYVYNHSAINMPPMYLFTSFWSALEGSHLLWTLIMSVISAVAIANVRPKNYELYPGLCTALSLALTFMLVLNVTVSAPFSRMFPVGHFGLGMNALLQNPYMAIHPPMLFTGYSLLLVPFAYSFAALLHGKITPEWMLTIRRWSLLAWAFLTFAIFLGGKWAYVELGWGGYWGWDPVENASFMPWIALTAALHSFLIYDKTKKLPLFSLFLSMFAFSLTFFGTFLTRSGVISSVHSFAQSDIGPTYLFWIVFLFTIMTLLVFTRGHLLQSKQKHSSTLLAKENILLFTNYFLLLLLAVVFFGTVFPLVIEAISGKKISIQQPFYNTFAPWIGLSLVSIMGIGNVAKWKQAQINNSFLMLILPMILSGVITVCFILTRHFDFKTSLCYFLVIWTLIVLILNFAQKLIDLKWNGILFLTHNRAFLGSTIVHIGFLICILGMSGNYKNITADVNLKLGESTEFQGYTLKNKGLTVEGEYNYKTIHAVIEETNNMTEEVFFIQPSRSKYTNNDQWFNEVGVHSTFWHDMYLVLASFDIPTQNVSLKMNLNPTVKLVWTSLAVMLCGVLISLTHLFKFNFFMKRVEENISSDKHNQSKTIAGLLVLLVFGLTFFALSGLSFASENSPQKLNTPSQITPTQMDPQFVQIAEELRCPTCLGMSIIESNTPQSVAMKAEIEQQMKTGKSKEQIVQYFQERYGDWILRKPNGNTPIGFMLWLVPVLGLILGPLLLFLHTMRKNKLQKQQRILLKQSILTSLQNEIEGS